jgi:uncharacterized protein YlxW (UPF0749 family)
MTAVNIASLSVLTTIGVNMMLDTMKEKKDQQLREEIKDRLHETLSESQRRLNKLETDVKDIVSANSYTFITRNLFLCIVRESM